MRIIELLSGVLGDEPVEVKGWVRTKRDVGDLFFLEINDGSCMSNIQAIIDKDTKISNDMRSVTTGSSVAVSGILVESPAAGQKYEIKADSLHLYGTADPQVYPLQKKRHSFEFLREIAHLRPRTNTFGAVMRVRNALTFAIHEFFQKEQFLYVHTPIITSSDCEGAGELFTVTAMELSDIPVKDGSVDYSADFFGVKTGLTVSGQLEGELMACALGKIYTFGPTFRAENSNTSRHLAEFWMVEPEVAFADLHDIIHLAERFIKYIFNTCLERCSEDMEFFNSRIQKGIIDTIEHIISSEFEIMPYSEAITNLDKSGKKFEYPVEWGLDLQSEHERYLTEELVKKPVFVIDYPEKIKPFYMKANDDGHTVRAMDLLAPGIGEIIGGSQREENLSALEERMIKKGLEPDKYSWYTDSRRFGTVPHAGFGLGLERTIQFLTGMQNIRDVIPFPRTPGNASF